MVENGAKGCRLPSNGCRVCIKEAIDGEQNVDGLALLDGSPCGSVIVPIVRSSGETSIFPNSLPLATKDSTSGFTAPKLNGTYVQIPYAVFRL